MSYHNLVKLAQYQILAHRAANEAKNNIEGTDTKRPPDSSKDKFRGLNVSKSSVNANDDSYIGGSDIKKSKVEADYGKFLPGTNALRPANDDSPQPRVVTAEGTDPQKRKYLHHKRMMNMKKHKHSVML